MRALALLLLLAGCSSGDDKTETGTPDDSDVDGYSVADGDCDDANPNINPGATERCNATDDDCDGETDEGLGSFHADQDGDGYGDPDGDTTCAAATGFVEDTTDCDDNDAAVSPGAAEVCNGVDDDCDGSADEDATDPLTFYADADGDGYGVDTTTTTGCQAPAGYAASSGDCDDTLATIHPGADEADCTDPTDYNCDGSSGYADEDADGFAACADCDDADEHVNTDAVEVCDDLDDDCDGDIDEDDAADGTVWYLDTDGDGYGDTDTSVQSCDQPTGYDADAGDCDDDNRGVNPGVPEVCDGFDDDCDGVEDESDSVNASTWYADADGDGYGSGAGTISCDSPGSGYVTNGSDCDDGNSAVSPGAGESCNGVDDDCDGTTDEDGSDAVDWYADADGDGHGDSATSQHACTQPSGYVATGDDCDDTDSAAFPGATELCTDTTDIDCDGTVSGEDADGDGWVACEECDDKDATVSPSASEACNGVDDDCDGTTDEADSAGWYADADGDGYGDPAALETTCDPSASYVLDATDCDDTSDAVSPAAAETCDSVDDDCDGTVDEADATDATTWYADADGDGYGDDAVTETACTAPAGYVATGGDCDDTSALYSPGVVEVCGDGRDQDCSGSDC